MTKTLAAKINRNFASIARLVLDPRYRGVSIAATFLRRVCELSPLPWIELTSEMANLVPFCEAAGFKLIGRGMDKFRRGAINRVTKPSNSPYGKSNWTSETFAKYLKRVRFSRPAYYLFDNRENCEQLQF